ncbi:MAG TPA: alpha-amylase/4-alpha-glucanotransferase domain-containing protein, partial [Nitrospirota bacterium]|nr:alpha-amylase/4-alpha-glucanotransferase domain-containing protein [Nitrospirota bacterium]
VIQAELLADKVLLGAGDKGQGKQKINSEPSWLEIKQGDFDQDGRQEVMLNSELLNLFIDPAEGGRISELDWKPRSFNLMNTLTRRREGYHDRILHAAKQTDAGPQDGGAKTIHERVAMKEEGLQYHLLYDWYTRGSLLDHFLGSGVDLVKFMRSEYYEAGDFVLGDYCVTQKRRVKAAVILERTGQVEGLRVRLKKEITLAKAAPEFSVMYEITNLSTEELNASFGSEFNFSLLAGDAHDRYYDIPGHTLDKRNLASIGEINDVSTVSIIDDWLKIRLSLAFLRPAILWRAPVETVSQSEGGFERVYQSSMVMPIWRISLQPGSSWEAEIRVKID